MTKLFAKHNSTSVIQSHRATLKTLTTVFLTGSLFVEFKMADGVFAMCSGYDLLR